MSKVLFLPTDYQAPKSSNFYMKFQEGENKFRILSAPIIGWEDWLDKKPIRFHINDKPAKPVDPKKPIKHFWSMVVWNYQEEEIQILHITQATIRRSLEALCQDSDWGAPYFYDLKVVKSGEGMETEYMLNPLPHKPLAAHIKDRFNERKCNLDALFHNEDPFSKDNETFTLGVFTQEEPQSKTITLEQVKDIENILNDCDPKYKIWALDVMKRQYGIEKLVNLTPEVYSIMRQSAVSNMNETHSKQLAAQA